MSKAASSPDSLIWEPRVRLTSLNHHSVLCHAVMVQSQYRSLPGSPGLQVVTTKDRGCCSLRRPGDPHLVGLQLPGQLSCSQKGDLNGSTRGAVPSQGRAGAGTGPRGTFQPWPGVGQAHTRLVAGRPPCENPRSGTCRGWRWCWRNTAETEAPGAETCVASLCVLRLRFSLQPCKADIRRVCAGGSSLRMLPQQARAAAFVSLWAGV